MSKETSNKLYSFLYLFALYLGVKLLPIKDWIPVTWVVNLLMYVFYLLVIALLVYESRKAKLEMQKNSQHLSYLLLIPLVIGGMSNLIYSWVFTAPIRESLDVAAFINNAGMTLCCVTIEELLFRFFFLYFLQDVVKDGKYKDILLILFSSLAFGLMHVVNFYGNNPLSVLTQIGYTVVLGLVLGFIALYFQTPIIPIIGHFIFNFLNTDLYALFYSLEMNTPYILTSLCIGIFVLGYVGILYYIARRKNEHATC